MSLAYFPLYADDFEADTTHLTLAEDGAYNRLLRLCWRTSGCSLPNDRDWIYRKMRARTDDEKATVDMILDEFFTVKRGRISNPRLTKEWKSASVAHERRKNAGKRGGTAKALKAKGAGASNAKAMPKQPEPEPEPDIREEPNGSLSSGDDAKPFDEIAECVAEYNATARQAGWPEVKVLSKSRRAALSARLKECDGIEGWRDALAKARASPHCCGQNDRGWTANFDFLTRQSSFLKLMEGQYDDRSSSTRHAPRRENRPDAALENIFRLAGLGEASGHGGG